MDTWDRLTDMLDRFGVAVMVAGWFMWRYERLMTRLTSRVNKLIITNIVMAKTLDLDEEQERLIRAAADEGSGEKLLPKEG